MEIHGKNSLRQRSDTLLRFRDSPNSEVLFVSNVGMTGLNIDCANIVIILVKYSAYAIGYCISDLDFQDVMWSKQDEMQLIGRVWRRPQSKQVYVYRLLGTPSPDTFLSSMSHNKAVMHSTFMGSESGWREFLFLFDSEGVSFY
jgi:hypothetical protein